MLKLYKVLEDQVTSNKTTALEKVKCTEIAANIAIDVLKLESEELRAIRQISESNKNEIKQAQRVFNNLNAQSKDNDESANIEKEYDPNTKF